jgi:hypothetical protein
MVHPPDEKLFPLYQEQEEVPMSGKGLDDIETISSQNKNEPQ